MSQLHACATVHAQTGSAYMHYGYGEMTTELDDIIINACLL